MFEISVASSSLRDHFLADHRRMDCLLEDVLAAVAADDCAELARLWRKLEASLLQHMEAEEQHLISALPANRERAARVLIQEHQHIRARLSELGTAIELHAVRCDSIQDFADVLRAHAASEDRLLYQPLESCLDETRRDAALRSVSGS